jgi:hypothetical protein
VVVVVVVMVVVVVVVAAAMIVMIRMTRIQGSELSSGLCQSSRVEALFSSHAVSPPVAALFGFLH